MEHCLQAPSCNDQGCKCLGECSVIHDDLLVPDRNLETVAQGFKNCDGGLVGRWLSGDDELVGLGQ